jgi:hypothetical protein
MAGTVDEESAGQALGTPLAGGGGKAGYRDRARYNQTGDN